MAPKYRNKTVEIYITRHKVFVFDLYTAEEIAEYDLSLIPGKKISKREFKREKGKTAKELKAQVAGMFKDENWEQFTLKNFKAFSRYVRDQCMEAKKYFADKDIEISILDEALKYCLKNETLSFANLNDTYIFFKREHEREDLEIITLSTGYQGGHKPLKVMTRDLSIYKNIISSQGTANESL